MFAAFPGANGYISRGLTVPEQVNKSGILYLFWFPLCEGRGLGGGEGEGWVGRRRGGPESGEGRNYTWENEGKGAKIASRKSDLIWIYMVNVNSDLFNI